MHTVIESTNDFVQITPQNKSYSILVKESGSISIQEGERVIELFNGHIKELLLPKVDINNIKSIIIQAKENIEMDIDCFLSDSFNSLQIDLINELNKK